MQHFMHECGDACMHVLALLARKGGAGKTTLAVHLGVQAQASGRRVLFCDLDPQRSLGGWWRLRQAASPALVETDAARLQGVIEAARADGADLVVIPLRPSILDIQAVGGTVEAVRGTGTLARMVLNACPAPRGMAEAAVTLDARKALAGYGVPVAEAAIADRRDFARALNGGEAV